MSGKNAVDLSRLDVIGAIESWWGDKFDKILVKRILSAPRLHLAEFFDYLVHDAARDELNMPEKVSSARFSTIVQPTRSWQATAATI